MVLVNTSDDKLIIGYDLANICSQISYSYINDEGKVETVSSVAGEENFDIPTVLCKKCGLNQWLFGKDALRYYEEYPEQGILIDNLWQLALAGELIQVEGKSYEPEALLTLFVKRSLGLLSGISSLDKIQSLMFTCEELSERGKEVLQIVKNGLGLKNTEIFMQDYRESYYGYMLYQPSDLWLYGSVLMDYRGNSLKLLRLENNKNTTPIVVYISGEEYSFRGEDIELLELAQELFGEERISSVYLIGEKFAGGWMKESLKYLCDGRRVFQGNNLYSKGACFCLQEKMRTSEAGKLYVFLGQDKLKANVGMKVLKRGEEAYFALLDAGIDWFEIDYECEVYLQDENCLELMVTPLIHTAVKRIEIPLEGLGLKEGESTRVYLHFTLLNEKVLCVEVEDLGFGCFRTPAETKWKHEITLYE